MRAVSRDHFSQLLYGISLLGALLGLTASLYLLAGLRGHLGSLVLNGVAAVILLLAALFFLLVFFLSLPQKKWPGLLIWLFILGLLVAEVVLGLVPPTARDELTHHLALPRLYLHAGRIFEIPFDHPSYFPMLLDMLFTPWVKWRWDFVPKLIHGLFGFLTGFLLYAYLARRLNPSYGLLGCLCFVFTPIVLRLGNLAYVDLGLTFYSTASLLCLLRWIEEKKALRWLILSGLSAGFALATKPNGLLVLLLLFFLMAFALGREKGNGLWPKALWLTLFLLLALAPFSPWAVKNLIWTGNPFFPLFTAHFGGGGGEVGGGPSLGILDRRRLFYGESWWQIAALPLRIFFSGADDRAQHFDGVLNPMLILFLPWAFKGKWVEEKRLLFAFALFYFLYALSLTELRIRYILPMVPPLVILLVYGIHNVYLRIARPSYLFAAVALLLTLNGIYLWNYFHAVSPLDYLKGRESREAYLSRMLPDYPAFRYINQQLPPAAKVYLIFMGRRVYYCERDYFYDASDNPWVLLRMIQGSKNGDEVKPKLGQRGITHLLVREELLKRFLDNNLTSQQKRIWDSFAARHLKGLFRERGYSLYQIHG